MAAACAFPPAVVAVKNAAAAATINNRRMCSSLVSQFPLYTGAFMNPLSGVNRALRVYFVPHISTGSLAGAFGERAQPQRVELDETRGIAMVVGASTFLEGHEVLIVEGIAA